MAKVGRRIAKRIIQVLVVLGQMVVHVGVCGGGKGGRRWSVTVTLFDSTRCEHEKLHSRRQALTLDMLSNSVDYHPEWQEVVIVTQC